MAKRGQYIASMILWLITMAICLLSFTVMFVGIASHHDILTYLGLGLGMFSTSALFMVYSCLLIREISKHAAREPNHAGIITMIDNRSPA